MSHTTHSFMSRAGVMIFNLLSYLLGASSLVLLILVFGNIVTPDNAPLFQGPIFDNAFISIAWNLALMVGFGYKHSAMASVEFKKWMAQFIPDAMNRGVYLLATASYLTSMLYFWSPLNGQLWSVNGELYAIVMTLFVFGWAFLFIATFMIDHFDLFGIKQAYYYFKNETVPELSFVQHGFYAYIRHPIMTGFMIGIWCVPQMSASLLMLSVGFSIYIVIGVYFEERKLKRILGDVYVDYCQEVGCLLPKIKRLVAA